MQHMLHCSLWWTFCLRILTESPAIPQELYKPASRGLSAIAELFVPHSLIKMRNSSSNKRWSWWRRQFSASDRPRTFLSYSAQSRREALVPARPTYLPLISASRKIATLPLRAFLAVCALSFTLWCKRRLLSTVDTMYRGDLSVVAATLLFQLCCMLAGK